MIAGKRWLIHGCIVAAAALTASPVLSQFENPPTGGRENRTNEYGAYGNGPYGNGPYGRGSQGQTGTPYSNGQTGGQSSNQQYSNQPQGGQQQGYPPYGDQQYQQTGGRQYGPQPRVADQRAADPRAGAPRGPVRPEWAPISQAEQDYIDKLLGYWEFKSSKIDRYRCRFKRWQYDPVFGPAKTFQTYSEGTVQYSAPDKGLFKVDDILHYTPPEKEGEQPKYIPRQGDAGEHWVCDGHWIYEFDYKLKKLIQHELPPEMRGKSIVDGPLPFLFGAKADQIKQRYWLHVVTPKDAQGEYWLEAVPRTMQDAGNFKKVEVILAEEDYLPKAIQIYPVNFDPHRNPARTVFEFERREVNYREISSLLPFNSPFFEPATPSGWERVVEPFRVDSEIGRLPPR